MSPTASLSLPLDGVVALGLRRQHLTGDHAAADLTCVVEDLLGLHATVPTSPYLQLRARMATFTAQSLDAALDDGRAAKLACMRRTLFIEPAALVPLVFAATRELTRGPERFLAANGLTRRRYERLAEQVEAALAGRALDARQLRSALSARERLSPVLIVMCDEGRLVRWKGRRGWRSGQPSYRRLDEALPSVRLDAWDERRAVQALVERYVRRYGPVRDSDIAWWTGLRTTVIREALAVIPGLLRVTVEGLDGSFLIHDDDVADAQRPAGRRGDELALLPVLDPYLQGYRHRDRHVDARHLPFVVDRGGNATSVLLVDGRVAGVWDLVDTPTPELRLLFFDPPDRRTRRRVHAAAAELARSLSGRAVAVVERDEMTPLTDGTAGTFLSPLRRT